MRGSFHTEYGHARELYPKAVHQRPCGSFFTKTTDVGQDLTWNNAKPSIKALTGRWRAPLVEASLVIGTSIQ